MPRIQRLSSFLATLDLPRHGPAKTICWEAPESWSLDVRLACAKCEAVTNLSVALDRFAIAGRRQEVHSQWGKNAV